MGLFDDDFGNFCGFSGELFDHDHDSWGCSDRLNSSWDSVNPANGLPMVGDIDIEGNLYGCNSWDDKDV